MARGVEVAVRRLVRGLASSRDGARQGFGAALIEVLRAFGKAAVPLDGVRFQLEYPEDIELFGISFNTTLGDWSIQGEVTYRPDMPLQVDGEEAMVRESSDSEPFSARPSAVGLAGRCGSTRLETPQRRP